MAAKKQVTTLQGPELGIIALLSKLEDVQNTTPDVQLEACKELFRQWRPDTATSLNLDLGRVARILVSLIKSDDKPSELFQTIASFFDMICKEDGPVEHVAKAGVLDRMVFAMLAFSDEMGVQAHTWAIVTILCRHFREVRIPELPVVAKHIAAVMEAHLKDVEAQKAGLAFLGNLMDCSTKEQRSEIVTEHVLAAVLGAMETHSQDLKIVVYGCIFLETAESHEGATAIDMMWKINNSIKTVTDAMAFMLSELIKDPKRMASSNQHVSVQGALYESLVLIENMYAYGDDVIHDEAGLTVLTRVVEAHIKCKTVLCQCMKTIFAAVQASQLNRQFLGTECISAICTMMQESEHDRDLCIDGFCVLYAISMGVEAHRDFLLAQNVPQLFVKNMKMHAQDVEFARDMIHSMGNITLLYVGGDMEALHTAGCAIAIAAAMIVHKDQTGQGGLLHTASIALHNLLMQTMPTNTQNKLVTDGVAEALISSMTVCRHCVPGIRVLEAILRDNAGNIKAIGQQAMRAVGALTLANADSDSSEHYFDVCFAPGYIMQRAMGLQQSESESTLSLNLSLYRTLQEGYAQGGGIQALSKCLSRLENQDVPNSHTILRNAFLSVAFAVMDHAHNQSLGSTQGIMLSMLRLMSKYSEDERIQKTGRSALHHLCKDCESNKAILAAEGGTVHLDAVCKSVAFCEEDVSLWNMSSPLC